MDPHAIGGGSVGVVLQVFKVVMLRKCCKLSVCGIHTEVKLTVLRGWTVGIVVVVAGWWLVVQVLMI